MNERFVYKQHKMQENAIIIVTLLPEAKKKIVLEFILKTAKYKKRNLLTRLLNYCGGKSVQQKGKKKQETNKMSIKKRK